MTENIQISDVTIVAGLGDTILLCVLNEDVENTNNPMAIQYNLGNNSFHIDEIQKFLKFTPFESIDAYNERTQDFYRGWIYRKLTNEKFVRSLVEFTPKENSIDGNIQKAYLLGLMSDDDIEKAWKKQAIGTTTTHKDGTKWRKQSETGNAKQDWVQVKNEGNPKKGENKENKEGKLVEGKVQELTPQELKEYAKNTSETALVNATKNSSDPEIRETAHDELDRRGKEEKSEEGKNKEDIKVVSKEEYESQFKNFSEEDQYSVTNDLYLKYHTDQNKIKKYLEENPDMDESIGVYTGSLYHTIRRYVSNPQEYKIVNKDNPRHEPDFLKKTVDNLSKLIDDNKIDEDLSLFRSHAYDEILGSLKVGDIYSDASFASTSLVKLNFGEMKIKILAKKGSNVANVDNPEEFEYLINKGSEFRILDTDGKNLTVELL
jgi:hypothetical protein